MLKIKKKTYNIYKDHTKILIFTTFRLNTKINPPETGKVAILVKSFYVEKA